MRLPEAHFLTKHYIDHFQIQTKPFQFSQSNAYIYLFGTKIRISGELSYRVEPCVSFVLDASQPLLKLVYD